MAVEEGDDTAVFRGVEFERSQEGSGGVEGGVVMSLPPGCLMRRYCCIPSLAGDRLTLTGRPVRLTSAHAAAQASIHTTGIASSM
jgi:hypothetical protein